MTLYEQQSTVNKNMPLRIRTEKAVDYEWTAEIININRNVIEQKKNGLHKMCNALYDYIKYVDRIKINQKNGMNIKTAVDEAVNWAIEENLLEGLIKEQKAEVTAMSLTEFDQELYDKNRRREGYEEGFECGEKSGFAKGAHENAVENAKNLLKEGDSPEKAARCTGLPLEEVQKLAEEVNKAVQ